MRLGSSGANARIKLERGRAFLYALFQYRLSLRQNAAAFMVPSSLSNDTPEGRISPVLLGLGAGAIVGGAGVIYAVKPGARSRRVLTGVLSTNVGIVHLGFSRNSCTRRNRHVRGLHGIVDGANGATTVLLSAGNPRVHAVGLRNNGSISLGTNRAFAFAASGSIVNGDRVITMACRNFAASLSINGAMLISSNLVNVRIATVRNGGIVYGILGGNSLNRGGNIGLPNISVTLPTLTRGSGRSLVFNYRRNMSFITTSFVHGHSSIVRVHRRLGTRNNRGVRVVSGVRGRRNLGGFSRVLRTSSNVVITHNSLNMRVPMRRIVFTRGVVVRGYVHTHGIIVATARVLSSVVGGPHPAHTRTNSITGTVLSNASTIVLSNRSTGNGCPLRTISVVTAVYRHASHIVGDHLRFGGSGHGLHVARTMYHNTIRATRGLSTPLVIITARNNGSTHTMHGCFPSTAVLTLAAGRGATRRLMLDGNIIPRLIGRVASASSFCHLNGRLTLRDNLTRGNSIMIVISNTLMPDNAAGATSIRILWCYFYRLVYVSGHPSKHFFCLVSGRGRWGVGSSFAVWSRFVWSRSSKDVLFSLGFFVWGPTFSTSLDRQSGVDTFPSGGCSRRGGLYMVLMALRKSWLGLRNVGGRDCWANAKHNGPKFCSTNELLRRHWGQSTIF